MLAQSASYVVGAISWVFAERNGFGAYGRYMLRLQEIVNATPAALYLLDEWDANLDAKNRTSPEFLVAAQAARAVVVEISHRDRV